MREQRFCSNELSFDPEEKGIQLTRKVSFCQLHKVLFSLVHPFFMPSRFRSRFSWLFHVITFSQMFGGVMATVLSIHCCRFQLCPLWPTFPILKLCLFESLNEFFLSTPTQWHLNDIYCSVRVHWDHLLNCCIESKIPSNENLLFRFDIYVACTESYRENPWNLRSVPIKRLFLSNHSVNLRLLKES